MPLALETLPQSGDSGVGAAEFTQAIIDAANKSEVLSNVTGGLVTLLKTSKTLPKLRFLLWGNPLQLHLMHKAF